MYISDVGRFENQKVVSFVIIDCKSIFWNHKNCVSVNGRNGSVLVQELLGSEQEGSGPEQEELVLFSGGTVVLRYIRRIQ